ncbi:MAG TPA: hypothetical protein VFC47_05725 [Caulobacteraceae bacterium]|nr:hypothetical protein [Caulobacteraceae bacterium]
MPDSDIPPDDQEDGATDVTEALTSSVAESLALRQLQSGAAAGETGGSRESPPPGAEARRFLEKQSRMLDIQMEHLHEQRSLTLSHLRLRRWNEALKVTFQALTILFGLIAAGAAGVILWQAHEAGALIVEPLRTTPELAQRGLDGTVLASRLLDKLREIQNGADSARAPASFTKDFGDDIKLEIPQTGVSIGEVQRYLRNWLGHDTHITGEVFRFAGGPAPAGGAGTDRIFVTVRAGVDPGDTVEGPEASLDELIQKGAEMIIAHTQPYRYTVYLIRQNRLEEANRALAKLAATGSPQDRPWAYLNWGLVSLVRDGDFAAAERKERIAVRLDPELVLAHDNLAGQETKLGHAESALAHMRIETRLLGSAPNRQLTPAVRPILLAWSRARLAGDLGDYRGAAKAAFEAQGMRDYQGIAHVAVLDQAAALAASHDISDASQVLDDAGWRNGTSSLQESFDWGSDLLPEIATDEARADWSGMRRDLAAAEASTAGPVWKRVSLGAYVRPWMAWATARSGDRPTARAMIAATPLDCYLCLRMRGRLAALDDDWPRAAGWFARATREAPSPPFAWLDWGRMLADKGDLAGAATMFRRAHERGPHFADPLEAWGEVLLRQNEAPGAIVDFEAAARAAPRWGRLHLMWGDALRLIGRREEALGHYRAAAHLDLNAPDAAVLARRLAAGRAPPS